MKSNLRNEIKSYIVRQGMTMLEVVDLLADEYKKMSADYEEEQERLRLEIDVIEEWVEQREEMDEGLNAFIALTQ